MFWLTLASVFVAAFLITAWVVRHAALLGLVHAPNHRSSHVVPTPGGGGVGIVVGGVVAVIGLSMADTQAGMWSVSGLALAIALVGLWDDIRPLPVLPRLIVHALACLGLALLVGLGAGGGALVVLLAGVWWLNLFNFMDGIDGLAGAQAVFMLSAAAWLAFSVDPAVAGLVDWRWMLLTIVAVMGFLVWNWPPARIFMGDIGSTYLGFMLIYFCLASLREGWLTLPVWLLLGALFLVDASVTILRRAVRGERWWEAHRDHVYQRLSRRLGRHRPVTLGFVAFNLFGLAPLAVVARHYPEWAWPLVALVYVVLIMAMLAYLHWDERGRAP